MKALDGVDLEVRQGETLGIVGETGSGKSVTALSVLRLIPQPPGKIEAGEAFVDIGEEEIARLEALRSEIRASLREVFGGKSDYSNTPVNMTLLSRIDETLDRSKTVSPQRKEELRKKTKEVREFLKHKDLLSMEPEHLRDIRGNTISMIFQEPMQALNPVYTAGDQIAESIILHRRRWLSRRIVLRMRAETVRRRTVKSLKETFRGRKDLPPGVDLEEPTRSDLELLLDVLEHSVSADHPLARDLRELVAFERLLGSEGGTVSIFARGLPESFQSRLYERECLRAAWKAADVVDELQSLASLAGRRGGIEIPWSRAEPVGPFAVALVPALGMRADVAATKFWQLVTAKEGAASAWAVLGQVLEKPRVEEGRLVVKVKEAYHEAKQSLSASWLARIPLLKRPILHPLQRQAVDEAAEVLRILRIPDPERVISMYPHELSGGMNQRVMIAIALACDPLLLIADEPTTALDVTIQAQILELLRELKARGRPSIILITHDLGVIAEMCDRVAVMYGGHVVEMAPLREVFKQPLHPYTQGLLKAIPSHAQKKERLEDIKGSVPNLIYPPSGCRFHPRCPAVMPHCGWDANDLEPVLKDLATEQGFDEDTIKAYKAEDPFLLRVSFADSEAGAKAKAALKHEVESARSSSVMFQAVQEIRSEGTDLLFQFLKANRPPDLDYLPGHMVACYLYARPVEVVRRA